MHPNPIAAAHGGGTAPSNALESAAYPPLLRTLTVVLLVDLVGLGLWQLPALLAVSWSLGSLLLFGMAIVGVVWSSWWIVYSRTRLEGDQLIQTWFWTKRARASEVAHLKLVHWRWLERIMAPRMLVRRRNGGITWFHAADARLLTEFSARVAQQAMPPQPPSSAS
ncbi:MAG: hypothetical protein PHI55_07295 [Burkholderiaceae bacterium]|nr:hypothetical protein [Burkholderiaceae bacterium]